MNARLVQYHDGELTQAEADLVQSELDRDPVLAEELEALEHLDRMTEALDRLMEPTPEQVARGRDALKRLLRRPSRPQRFRRWAVGAAVFGAIAACLAIVWYVQSWSVIGTVQYKLATAGSTGSQLQEVHRGETIYSSNEISAGIRLRDVAVLGLGGNGALIVSNDPTVMKLLRGYLTVQSNSKGLQISAGSVPYRIDVEPNSSIRVLLGGGLVRIHRDRGTICVSGGGRQETISGEKQTLELPDPGSKE